MYILLNLRLEILSFNLTMNAAVHLQYSDNSKIVDFQ